MKVLSGSQDLTRVVDNLVSEYSQFFGMDETLFDTEIEIEYRLCSYPRYTLHEITTPRKATITFQSYTPKWFNVRIFAHEVRHLIHHQVISHVIKENPEAAIGYLNKFDIMKDETVLKEELLRHDIDNGLIQRVMNRNSSNDLSQEDTELVYRDLVEDQRWNQFESFAHDSPLLDTTQTIATHLMWLLPGICAVEMGRISYDAFQVMDNFTWPMTMAATSAAFAGLAVYLSFKYKGFALGFDAPLHRHALRAIPVNDRKYFVTAPPLPRTGYLSHAVLLRELGFPVEYGK